MLFGGAALLAAHIGELNDLNVFPVADGDTGTNMLKTMEGGLAKVESDSSDSVGELSDHFAKGMLLGARGNSGVILSQIFAGINEELASYTSISAKELSRAYLNGIKKAYTAVQNPTEGTILTVFRESSEYAAEKITDDSSVEDFFRLHIDEARRSLASTKEILPALKEADVVDSGAAGYLYIAEGMYEALSGKKLSYEPISKKESESIDIDGFTRDSVLEFGYCTEFLLRLTTSKTDPDSFDIRSVLDILNELRGESVVAYKTGDIVKVHVHTFNPGEILSRMLAFGEFLTVKIENMSLGHTEEKKEKKNTPKKKYAVVAVASGEGMCALFCDMGADRIVSGGQTSNPSAEEFVSAFDECAAENIIVLPNNKNVYLAAKQATELYDAARVHIIPTSSLMQGYGALSVITPGVTDVDALVRSAERAAKSVLGIEITRAVRDATVGGVAIKAGDYMAISEGGISAVSTSAEDAVLTSLDEADMDDYEIMTVFAGAGADREKRAELIGAIEEKYPDIEVTTYDGGQGVYDYLIALE